MSAPDFRCTGWIDGWPAWMGGTGEEWLHCCVAHDLAAKTVASDLALGKCVAAVSPLMGAAMAVGVLTFGTLYVALRRRGKTGKRD